MERQAGGARAISHHCQSVTVRFAFCPHTMCHTNIIVCYGVENCQSKMSGTRCWCTTTKCLTSIWLWFFCSFDTVVPANLWHIQKQKGNDGFRAYSRSSDFVHFKEKLTTCYLERASLPVHWVELQVHRAGEGQRDPETLSSPPQIFLSDVQTFSKWVFGAARGNIEEILSNLEEWWRVWRIAGRHASVPPPDTVQHIAIWEYPARLLLVVGRFGKKERLW